MRSLIATMALMILIGSPAEAQTRSNSSASGATTPSPSAREAPIGHRQPRASDFPAEKNANNVNDLLEKENAALDRKIKSICRGC